MEIKMSEPNPSSLVESIRDIGYTLDSAVADLVDNSISAGANNVEIYTDYDGLTGTIKFAIVDNGRGLSEDELISAMAVVYWSSNFGHIPFIIFILNRTHVTIACMKPF